MKIDFSLTAETAGDLLQQLKDFVHDEGVGSPKKKTTSKTEEPADDEPEEKPKKKAASVKKAEQVDDEADLTDAGLRAAIKGNDWPIEQSKAFVAKFGYASIPEIPAKKRQAFLDELTEAGTWSAKKLSAYLEDED